MMILKIFVHRHRGHSCSTIGVLHYSYPALKLELALRSSKFYTTQYYSNDGWLSQDQLAVGS